MLKDVYKRQPNSIEFIHGTQSGIWGLFGDLLVVSWLYADHHAEYADAALADAKSIAQQLPQIIAHVGLPNGTATRYSLHAGKLNSQSDVVSMASQWRSLFAQAVLKLEHPEQ